MWLDMKGKILEKRLKKVCANSTLTTQKATQWVEQNCDQHYYSKGQLISKGNFSVFNPPKKLENVNFCPSLLGQKFIVRFWGELKKPKSPFKFEIN
jgi:hypothetical protein